VGLGGVFVEKDVRDAAQADGSGGAIRDVAVLDLPGTVKQVVPLKGLRGAIARRMHQSLSMSAQYTLTIGIDITEALRQRREFNQKRSESENRVRFLDIVIKAVTHSLQSHPGMNAVILGEEVLWINETHIGIAVAVDDGLIVPVLRDAGLMSLTEIARTAQDIEVRARAKQLTSSEVNGSTFTISLLGIVDAFTPIINPPEVAILGIGRATEKPAVVKGQVVPRSFATFSLTLDHRAIDGAVGASFLRRLLRLIEQPSQFFSI
jgi:pyruvate dehydrogenase E2 component (dihydrolipoamide acetyltransferase)